MQKQKLFRQPGPPFTASGATRRWRQMQGSRGGGVIDNWSAAAAVEALRQASALSGAEAAAALGKTARRNDGDFAGGAIWVQEDGPWAGGDPVTSPTVKHRQSARKVTDVPQRVHRVHRAPCKSVEARDSSSCRAHGLQRAPSAPTRIHRVFLDKLGGGETERQRLARLQPKPAGTVFMTSLISSGFARGQSSALSPHVTRAQALGTASAEPAPAPAATSSLLGSPELLRVLRQTQQSPPNVRRVCVTTLVRRANDGSLASKPWMQRPASALGLQPTAANFRATRAESPSSGRSPSRSTCWSPMQQSGEEKKQSEGCDSVAWKPEVHRSKSANSAFVSSLSRVGGIGYSLAMKGLQTNNVLKAPPASRTGSGQQLSAATLAVSRTHSDHCSFRPRPDEQASISACVPEVRVRISSPSLRTSPVGGTGLEKDGKNCCEEISRISDGIRNEAEETVEESAGNSQTASGAWVHAMDLLLQLKTAARSTPHKDQQLSAKEMGIQSILSGANKELSPKWFENSPKNRRGDAPMFCPNSHSGGHQLVFNPVNDGASGIQGAARWGGGAASETI